MAAAPGAGVLVEEEAVSEAAVVVEVVEEAAVEDFRTVGMCFIHKEGK